MSEPIYGLCAEFRQAGDLVVAARAVRDAGYTKTDAFSPVPIEGLSEALGAPLSPLPRLVFIGGLLGCIGGFLLQYFTAVHTYPLNIGGRPLNSWPMFIPVMFECTILGAALTCVLGMLAINGLPMPYHPLFHLPRFSRASRDLFFLCVEAKDPKFDRDMTKAFLLTLSPNNVVEVPR